MRIILSRPETQAEIRHEAEACTLAQSCVVMRVDASSGLAWGGLLATLFPQVVVRR